MESSSLSSSSFLEKSSERRISLDALPDELLVEVSARTTASSLSAFKNLRVVSKTFRQTCDEKYVISRLSLHELPLIPWQRNPQRFYNFFKRCRRNGNPEALYRTGLIKYFRDNQKHKGVKLLSKAAEKGNKEANYVYAMIIICSIPEGPGLLGDETKQDGFKILSSLGKPLMSKTLKELVQLRNKTRGSIGCTWQGKWVMKELKRAYVREKCECDGRTKKFLLAYNNVWHRYGEDNDMNTSSACEFCLWDHEVELFFDNI